MSQTDKLYEVLKDGRPHRSDALVEQVYGLKEGVWLARLSARIYDVKKRFGVEIDSWKAPEKSNLQYYKLQKFRSDLDLV